jgi:cell shape-determining protein MreC
MATRSPEEIRGSIERTRRDLVVSVEELRSKVQALTDWRRQVNEHRTAVIVGATVVGFAVGGGIAALLGRRRRDQ